MLLRSFAVQGSWNYETLIGTGFAFTILPALRCLYGSKGERLEAAVGRHVDLFNSHPYFVTVAVGAVSRLEADETDGALIQRFKTALRGSLGSLGDRLVWTTWRPLSMLLAVVLLLAGVSWWGAVMAFLIVYNVMHIWVRVYGLRLGVESGLEIGRVLRETPLQGLIDNGARIASVLVGVAVVMAAAPAMRDSVAAVLTLVAVGLGFWLGMGTRRVMIVSLAATAAVALLLGILGYGA